MNNILGYVLLLLCPPEANTS